MNTIRKYGKKPFQVGLRHGGAGVQGEMKPVAENLSVDFGIIEFLQTEKSVNGQIKELSRQITESADLPVSLIGYPCFSALPVLAVYMVFRTYCLNILCLSVT